MLTYFEASMIPADTPTRNVVFEVRTIVDKKKVKYNYEINYDMLATVGFLDHMFDQFKNKVKDVLNEEKDR